MIESGEIVDHVEIVTRCHVGSQQEQEKSSYWIVTNQIEAGRGVKEVDKRSTI